MLSYVDLAQLRRGVERSIDDSSHYLRTTFLPSVWSKDGKGWQELLGDCIRHGRPAGFYASCDGLSILSQSSTWSTPAVQTFARDVFAKTLSPVFQNHSALTAAQRRMCDQVIPNTMKLARFVRASTLWRGEQEVDAVASKVVATLERRCLQGWWPASTVSRQPSLAATIEATLALARWHGSISRTIQTAVKSLLTLVRKSPKTGVEKCRWMVTRWAILQLLDYLHGSVRRQITHALICPPDPMEAPTEYREDFFVTSDDHDYYNYDLALLNAQSELLLSMSGMTDGSEALSTTPIVAGLVDSLRTHLFANADGPDETFRFWRYYQGIELLVTLRRAMSAHTVPQTGVFMLIQPKVFPSKKYALDKKLSVVLMPFREPWSDDVYATIRATLKAKGMRPWRSDEEFKDDKIVESIWEYINRAGVVVCDCTNKNPNVFYELGLAHAIGKPVFICAQSRADIPFDIESIRHFPYSIGPSGIKKLKNQLSRFIDGL